MKKIEIKNIYQIVAIILFIIGVGFTYLVAEIDDAPGFILLGSSIVTGACLLLFGLGSLIDISKTNNKVLKDIYQEIKEKSK